MKKEKYVSPCCKVIAASSVCLAASDPDWQTSDEEVGGQGAKRGTWDNDDDQERKQ